MTTLTFSVDLPDSLIAEVEAAGILTNEHIAALLKMELRRNAAWERLNAASAIAHDSFAAEYGPLSDDEIMQLVDEEIHLMRAEDDAREALKRPGSD